MKRIIILLAVLGAATIASTAQAASWPTHCTNMRCVNKHLNALHKASRAQGAKIGVLTTEVNDLLNNTPPGNAVLQAEIDATNNRVDGVQSDIAQIWNTPALDGCWQALDMSRFTDAGEATVDPNEWTNIRNNPTGAGFLDVSHSNQSANGVVYRMIFNACTTG